MDNQVKVTLTSLNGDVTPAQRSFFLNPDRCAISVGRASKSASKGLLGAADNAWFDSPVMSRHHARMTFNKDEKTIMIEDIGSMHGTYLNNVQLPSKNVTTIEDDDEVKFGAEVRRGPEVFPACRFRVNYEFVPYRAANTFEVPEYSDIDDEDEEEDGEEERYGFSDEAGARGQTSSEDGVSIEFAIPDAPKGSDPIDLTRDDSPMRHSLIDLTSDTPVETPAETAIMGLMAGRPTDINEGVSYTNIAVYAGNPLTVCEDSEEEDAKFSSDSEDQVNDEDDDSSSSESSVEYGLDEVLDEILDNDNGEVGESDGEYPDEYPMEDDEDDAILESRSAMQSIHRFANATNDYTIVRLSEPLPADESSADEEDNESDFGLSEAGAEGLKVLLDGGLIQKLPEQLSLSTSNATVASKQAPQIAIGRPSFHTSNEQLSIHPMQTPVGKPMSQAEHFFRQPSPSDAAMVKSHASITSIPISTPVQSLGDISGKNAFFAAREVNKQKFLAEEAKNLGPQLINSSGFSNIGGGPAPLFESANTSLLVDRPSDVLGPLSSNTIRNTFNVDSAMPRRDECIFLDRAGATPIIHRAASPLLDMTSAVTYSAAKDLAAKSVPKASVLKIQDLCGEPLPPQTSLKRKAQEISNDSGEDLRTWANCTSHALQKPPTVATPMNDEPAIAPTIDSPPPAKRFKKFLEKVGYAAIGGVAVGGALFTALIATAPEFI